MGTKEQKAAARAAAANALVAQAEQAATKGKDLEPMVLLALLEQAKKLAVTSGNQDAAARLQEKAKEVRKALVEKEAKKVGFRLVIRNGSTDKTLGKVRIPEDEVPEGFADDLTRAFMVVCKRHEIEIDD